MKCVIPPALRASGGLAAPLRKIDQSPLPSILKGEFLTAATDWKHPSLDKRVIAGLFTFFWLLFSVMFGIFYFCFLIFIRVPDDFSKFVTYFFYAFADCVG